MGLNQRYISKKTIINTISNGDSINKLFSSDVIILEDKFSSEIYNFYKNGLKDKEIINIIKRNDKKYENKT